MPLWKLQTVAGVKLDFLYSQYGESGFITLEPSVSFCFRKHYQLVLDLVTGARAQYIRRHNPNRLQEKPICCNSCLAVIGQAFRLFDVSYDRFNRINAFTAENPSRTSLASLITSFPGYGIPSISGITLCSATKHATSKSQIESKLPYT